MESTFQPEPPKTPWLHFLAVALEGGMLIRFLAHSDWWGVGLWIAYFWWSATMALIARTIRGDT